jgi:uncharacterized repeat protein (TIGR03803 family)
MQRTRQAVRVGKPSWWKTACAVCVLCAATAIASPAQTFTTLYSFDSTDGSGPHAGLVQATDGSLFGTATSGGANGDGGTVFKITPTGTMTLLYSFCSRTDCSDGETPFGGLAQASDGNLSGTTSFGGGRNGGEVFKVTPSGSLTGPVYNFCSQTDCTDGAFPNATLLQAADGNFYGTTFGGGANGNYGTVFQVTPSAMSHKYVE